MKSKNNTPEIIAPLILLLNFGLSKTSIIKNKQGVPDALSTRHVHAVVAATVRVVRKKLISCKIDFSGMGCCGAV